MNKVERFPNFQVVEESGEPRGTLRASIRIPVVDINGREVMRSVSLGVDHCATLEESRAKVRSAREANREQHVSARFSVDL